jgi:hypothetical protein
MIQVSVRREMEKYRHDMSRWRNASSIASPAILLPFAVLSRLHKSPQDSLDPGLISGPLGLEPTQHSRIKMDVHIRLWLRRAEDDRPFPAVRQETVFP